MVSRLRKYRILLWIFPILLIWLSLRETPLGDVAVILVSLEPWQILSLIAINSGIFLLFTSRWWLILRIQGCKIPIQSLLAYRLAGFGLTYLTPGPQMGGEPLQIHLVRSRHGIPASTSVAAVTLDKLLELQANFAFLVLGVALVLKDGLFADHLGPAALLLVLGLLALPAGYLLLLGLNRRPLFWLANRFLLLQPPRPVFSRFQTETLSAEAQVSRFLREHPLALFIVLLLSLLISVAMLLEFWLSLQFLGIQLDPLGAIILLTSARIAFLLPIPAGAGSLEAALVLTAGVLGIPPALAISLSLLIRLRDLSLAGLGLSLGAALTRSSPATTLPVSGSD